MSPPTPRQDRCRSQWLPLLLPRIYALASCGRAMVWEHLRGRAGDAHRLASGPGRRTGTAGAGRRKSYLGKEIAEDRASGQEKDEPAQQPFARTVRCADNTLIRRHPTIAAAARRRETQKPTTTRLPGVSRQRCRNLLATGAHGRPAASGPIKRHVLGIRHSGSISVIFSTASADLSCAITSSTPRVDRRSGVPARHSSHSHPSPRSVYV